MSPWGLVGGGPMNTQQIDNVLEYLKSIQLPRTECGPAKSKRLISTVRNFAKRLGAD